MVILFSVHENCAEVYKSGDKISGVYKINPDGLGEFQVFSDQKLKLPVEVGRCFRRGEMALLISSAPL